ncbi:MAG: ATP-binding protein [Methanoregula sp.]
MTMSPSLPGFGGLSLFRLSPTDLVRFCVITSITFSIIGITYLSRATGYGALVPQLFYFPILYTTYFYPERGLYVACSCAAAYLFITLSFVSPEFMNIGGIIFQALLFVGIAAGSGYIIRSRDFSPYLIPKDDTRAIQGMIKTGENDHVEFKLQSLWSAGFTREEISTNESPEVRKYRTNASKFIIARSIAGFLNTDGGELIIGIREDRHHNTITVTGIENDYPHMHEEDRNPDGYRRMIVDSVIRKYLPEIFESASRFIHISFPVVSGKTLCHLHITPSDKPIFVDSGTDEIFFIRVDASTRAITGKTLTRYTLTRFSSG